MWHGLDRVRVFHTFFHHRVAPLAERTRPMWLYSSLMDLDHASLVELAKDEVWSRLDRVLQLKARETLEGKPGPLHARKLPNLVCSPFSYSMSLLISLSYNLTSSHPFHRDSSVTNPSCTFQRGQRVWLGRWP